MIIEREFSDYILNLINQLDREDKIIYALVAFMPHSLHLRLWFKDDSINKIEEEIKNKFRKELINIRRDESAKLLEVTIVRKEIVKVRV